MHSFYHEEIYVNNRTTTTINHNSDYSGLAHISVRTTPLTLDVKNYEEIDTYPEIEIEVPIRAFKEFIAEYVRNKKIGDLELATTEELLGL